MDIYLYINIYEFIDYKFIQCVVVKLGTRGNCTVKYDDAIGSKHVRNLIPRGR